ncbi:MAG TPA: diguanylate cyclase [Oculatellaceae cyanobacterium]|jgi:diguanylate cyclase (GGDEF)-like protein/putative nucleotidyltransferase with HDIG domain
MSEKPESKLSGKGLARAWTRFCGRLSSRMDQCATALIHAKKIQMARKPYASALSKTRITSPEDEIKKLLTSAVSLNDVWQFFLKRLKSGSALDFMCFSVRDERGDFIRVRFVYDGVRAEEVKVDQEPFISMLEPGNHLAQSYCRKDTTFSPRLNSLGEDILVLLPEAAERLASGDNAFNLFSVPMIAGDQVIALLTLGFKEMDSFSQAKLSYVYTLRDQLAQLVWNLILRERMQVQAQIDNLTGLLSYTYFQGLLDRELARADACNTSATVMILDINNIQEINQTQGHLAGDEAICHLASTVRRLVRGVDTVARYGGDEVVVLLPDTGPQAAAEIAQRFMEGVKVHLPAALEGLSISIGHASYPDDTRARDQLLRLAEQALHLAKFKGAKTGESTHIASGEVERLNDKTVIEVFASQVAKKYNNIHVPSVYQELVTHIEKKADSKVKPDDLMLETVTSLAGALEAKDRYTRGHSQAVSNYAVALAHALKMSPAEVEEIRAAAFLHDIGKIGIPESILCKPGPLNEKEWEIMKQHPVIGAQQILYPVASLRPIIPAVECHHENWDGSGHPYGYRGEKIPLGARIISIVDAFHALTSERAYRKALPVYEARKILEAGSGTKWDPNLIQIFFNILTAASPRLQENAEDGTPAVFRAGPVQLKLETAVAGLEAI